MPVNIFVSYKHIEQDVLILNEIMSAIHERITKKGGKFWLDQEIRAGEDWDNTIKENLRNAHIGLILVSKESLKSHYISTVEIPELKKRWNRKEIVVIPIIIDDCDWDSHEWLKQIQVLPGGRKNIIQHYADNAKRRVLYEKILGDIIQWVKYCKKNMSDTDQTSDLPVDTLINKAEKLNVIKEDADGRFNFLKICSEITHNAFQADRSGATIRIATQSGGPWSERNSDGRESVNYDRVLLNYGEIIARENLKPIRIVCPFSLSNLWSIYQWFRSPGINIKIHSRLVEASHKYLLTNTIHANTLVLGFPDPDSKSKLPYAESGVKEFALANRGFQTRDFDLVTHFTEQFDSLYNEGVEFADISVKLVTEKLVEYFKSNFDDWIKHCSKHYKLDNIILFADKEADIEIDFVDNVFTLTIRAKRRDTLKIEEAITELARKYDIHGILQVISKPNE